MKINVIEKNFPVSKAVRELFNKAGIGIYSDEKKCPADSDWIISDYDFTEEYAEFLCAKAIGLPGVIVNTERLQIREIGLNDLSAYKALLSECSDFLDEDFSEMSENDFKKRHEEYIKYHYNFFGFGLWGLWFKNEPDKLIGLAGVSGNDHTLSYCITREYRNKGFAYEACSHIIRYMAEEHSVNDITAVISEDNEPSIHLAKKLGIEIRIIKKASADT